MVLAQPIRGLGLRDLDPLSVAARAKSCADALRVRASERALVLGAVITSCERSAHTIVAQRSLNRDELACRVRLCWERARLVRRTYTIRRLGLWCRDVLHVITFRVLRARRQRLAHTVAGASWCLELVLRVVITCCQAGTDAIDSQRALCGNKLSARVRI